MPEYEIGNHVAYEKMRDNVLDWVEGDGDVELEEYIQILMDSETSKASKFHDLQVIGLELGYQGGEEVSAEDLYKRIVEADDTEGEEIFGLSPETVERAFFEVGYNAALRMEEHHSE